MVGGGGSGGVEPGQEGKPHFLPSVRQPTLFPCASFSLCSAELQKQGTEGHLVQHASPPTRPSLHMSPSRPQSAHVVLFILGPCAIEEKKREVGAQSGAI